MAGLDIGGYEQRPDWPKMGPSLLIAACLVLAIRTAKWPPRSSGGTTSDRELEVEIENAVHLVGPSLQRPRLTPPDDLSSQEGAVVCTQRSGRGGIVFRYYLGVGPSLRQLLRVHAAHRLSAHGSRCVILAYFCARPDLSDVTELPILPVMRGGGMLLVCEAERVKENGASK